MNAFVQILNVFGLIVFIVVLVVVTWLLMNSVNSLVCGFALKAWARKKGLRLLSKKCYLSLFAPRNPLPFQLTGIVCRVALEDAEGTVRNAWTRVSPDILLLLLYWEVTDVVWDD